MWAAYGVCNSVGDEEEDKKKRRKNGRRKKEDQDPTNTLKGVGMGYAGTGYVGRSTMGQTAAAGDGTWEVMAEVGRYGPRWGSTWGELGRGEDQEGPV